MKIEEHALVACYSKSKCNEKSKLIVRVKMES